MRTWPIDARLTPVCGVNGTTTPALAIGSDRSGDFVCLAATKVRRRVGTGKGGRVLGRGICPFASTLNNDFFPALLSRGCRPTHFDYKDEFNQSTCGREPVVIEGSVGSRLWTTNT